MKSDDPKTPKLFSNPMIYTKKLNTYTKNDSVKNLPS